MKKLCTSDLEQFSGLSMISLCGAWQHYSPSYMAELLNGYITIGSATIPNAAWDDLGTLRDVCREKVEAAEQAAALDACPSLSGERASVC